MAESQEVELNDRNKKYAYQKKFGFIKMKVITGGYSEKLFIPVIKQNVEKDTIIKSDGSTSYSELKDNFDHQPKTIPKKKLQKHCRGCTMPFQMLKECYSMSTTE